MNLEQILLLIVGLLITFFGGITGILLQSRKGKKVVKLLGETPARVLYLVIGIALIVLAFII